jgi:hypothetical protein
MKHRQSSSRTTPAQAKRWAKRLAARVTQVLAEHPQADPDNVRHCLILLELPPFERLRRCLIRGRAGSPSPLSKKAAVRVHTIDGLKRKR